MRNSTLSPVEGGGGMIRELNSNGIINPPADCGAWREFFSTLPGGKLNFIVAGQGNALTLGMPITGCRWTILHNVNADNREWGSAIAIPHMANTPIYKSWKNGVGHDWVDWTPCS